MTLNDESQVLLRSPTDPPALVAAMLDSRFNPTFPVPIDEIAREYASVEDADWTDVDCDGMVVGLHKLRKPKIFLRSQQYLFRRRFTLAHELGHVKLAWHLGVFGCHPTPSQAEDPRAEADAGKAAATGSILGAPLRIQEEEATRFASQLLLPERLIRESLSGGGLQGVLSDMNLSDVSTIACVIRLKEALRPGYIFLFNDPERRMLYSSGTRVPAYMWGVGADEVRLRADSITAGQCFVSGKTVRWFQLAAPEIFTPEDDPRTTRELLLAAIARSGAPNSSHPTIERSLNGVVGAALTVHAKGVDAHQTLSILRHRTDNRERYGTIVDQPEFDLYLRRKTREWMAKQKP